jgi:cell division protein FtsB
MNKKTLFWTIAIILIFSFPFIKGYVKIRQLRTKNTDLMYKNRKLQAENILLKQELSRIEKDSVYQEQILRDKLGVVKKDEIPVKIVTEATD